MWKILCLILALPILLGAAPAQKPYTIMIYMNGSDLESDFGLATADLAEMLDSGIQSHNANVIIFTGGTRHWQNTAIPEYECIIWQLKDGYIHELKPLGNLNMANPDTLRDFVIYAMGNFPAQKYGLIMWDHGGGSIAGFGHDENFNNGALTLSQMAEAFTGAGLHNNKLEFLGFDACLMASVEMAVVSADYAHVLVASEDLEPGDGWDYRFLGVLNDTPHMSGVDLGKVIVDTFIEFYGPDSEEILTLSVVDLAKVHPVMEAMGALMAVANGHMPEDFYALATRRGNTKTFGEGSPRDNYADMVDIGDMAIHLGDLFPRESRALLQALDNAVLYNRHNANVDIWGLSAYYIYGGKSQGVDSLNTYAALDLNQNYTHYLKQFFHRLYHGEMPQTTPGLNLWQPLGQGAYAMVGRLQTDAVGAFLWPRINGHPVAMYPMATTANARFYVIPATINDAHGDIVVSFSNANPQGRILGWRRQVHGLFPKGFDPILPGDRVAFSYQMATAINQNTFIKTNAFINGKPFIAEDVLNITWENAPENAVLQQSGAPFRSVDE